MIYEQRHYNVRYGKAQEHARRLKRFQPLWEKHGAKLVGVWTTDIGSRDTQVVLIAFQDMAARTRFWRDVYQDGETAKLLSEMGEPVVESCDVSILVPEEFSPLK